MSAEPDPLSPEDRDLEAELKRLVPAAMEDSLLKKLAQDQAQIAAVRGIPLNPHQNKWLMFSLACCFVAFCGLTVLSWRHHLRSSPSSVTAPAVGVGNDDGLVDRANVGRPASPGFVPVSSQGYIRHASSRGFIDSETGPREEIEIDYEEVEHWHDPHTATNIRIYSPRRETIVVPVETY